MAGICDVVEVADGDRRGCIIHKLIFGSGLGILRETRKFLFKTFYFLWLWKLRIFIYDISLPLSVNLGEKEGSVRFF